MTPLDETQESLPDRQVTLRLPELLALRVDTIVKKRQEQSKISKNEWIIETIRQRLDGPDPEVIRSAGGSQADGESVTTLFPTEVLEIAAKSEAEFGLDVGAWLLDKKRSMGTSTNPATQPPRKSPWLAELQKMQGRDDAQDLFDALLGYRQVKFPKGWATMGNPARAKWLDENYPLEGK